MSFTPLFSVAYVMIRPNERSSKRSILFLNRFYWPDVAATGQMLTDLAEDLAAAGWTVTVVTSLSGYDAARRSAPTEQLHKEVRILRVGGTAFGRQRTIGRLLDYLTYFVGSAVRALQCPRHDVYVALTDPPFIIGVALFVARLKRGKVVYWVQDLFPQIAAAVGVMKPRTILYRTLLGIARWLNARVDLVIALGEQMATSLARNGAALDRTRVVHNWSDSDAIKSISREDNPFLEEHGLQGRFVVLYSGNAGRAHRFDALIHAAREMQYDKDVVFVFVGGGHCIPQLKMEAVGLENVKFLGYVPREMLSFSLSAASVSVVTEDTRVIGTVVPSKTYGILASGRPVLFIGGPDSDVARVVTAAACGLVINEGDGPGVVDAIRRLKSDPELAAVLGANARQASVETFDRVHGTRNWERVVLNRLTELARNN